MHTSAINNFVEFITCYGPFLNANQRVKAVEIGSMDVNGSLRSLCPQEFDYVGVDFSAGKNVDIVLDDPYTLPFADNSVDLVISSSCFEHAEMFWVTFLEVIRILKQDGLFYLNVPSNGCFHRYPVDCWRFYPDSGWALVTWARRNHFNTVLLESYTSNQAGEEWNDFVAVFIKNEDCAGKFPSRIVDTKSGFSNGMRLYEQEFINYELLPEDQRLNLNLIKRHQ